MNYNIFYKTQVKAFNIPDVEETVLYTVVDAFEKERKVVVKGITYDLSEVIEFRIFEYSNTNVLFENFRKHCNTSRLTKDGAIPPEHLTTLGNEVTAKFVKNGVKQSSLNYTDYVASSRIEELKQVKSKDFKLDKLVVLLEELNIANKHSLIHAKGMLLRSIIDHVPPALGCRTFNEVSSSYKSPGSSQSFKKAMEALQNFKSSADAILHSQMRRSESLVTDQQVEFRGQLDVLLQEIVMRINNE